ncbi:hypothetical protein AX16_005705 [Volvariella volvacea WC 439]|nr:hypothetical protein AX16_005705 [Volvariella volvacea WC 439]
MTLVYHIRPAQPTDADIAAILQLIIDLAEYERERDAVKATPELLRRNLFEQPYAHALLAFSGTADAPGEAIGLALYFFNFSTWTGRPGLYLEDLYVKPEFRSFGLGKALFSELGKVAEEKVGSSIKPGQLPQRDLVADLLNCKGCARLDWSVLTWNQPSIDFYKKSIGAIDRPEWVGMRLEEDGIARLRNFGTTRQA